MIGVIQKVRFIYQAACAKAYYIVDYVMLYVCALCQCDSLFHFDFSFQG